MFAKSFLDLLERDALADKVILPIALGGTLAHFLILDYALKPVLNALGARHIFAGVYILDTRVALEEGNRVNLADEAEVRLRKSLYMEHFREKCFLFTGGPSGGRNKAKWLIGMRQEAVLPVKQ